MEIDRMCNCLHWVQPGARTVQSQTLSQIDIGFWDGYITNIFAFAWICHLIFYNVDVDLFVLWKWFVHSAFHKIVPPMSPFDIDPLSAFLHTSNNIRLQSY